MDLEQYFERKRNTDEFKQKVLDAWCKKREINPYSVRVDEFNIAEDPCGEKDMYYLSVLDVFTKLHYERISKADLEALIKEGK